MVRKRGSSSFDKKNWFLQCVTEEWKCLKGENLEFEKNSWWCLGV